MARKPTVPPRKTARAVQAKQTSTGQKPAAVGKTAKTQAPKVAAGKRTMPVHALGDERTHLALPHMGKLRQGTLKTLCGVQAVSALSPFALAETERTRCPACFRRVDADLKTKG